MSWGGATGTRQARRLNIAIGVAVAVVVLAGGFYLARGFFGGQEFAGLAAEGKGVLAKVERFPSLGQRHLGAGESYGYGDRFPTSGPHDPRPTSPGFYTTPQPPTRLVHALEHGSVVIYYDKLPDEARKTLRSWASLYGGDWDGLVVTPSPGLGEAVVLTAWRNRLRLERFDPAAAAAFVDAFRGRGPENKVR